MRTLTASQSRILERVEWAIALALFAWFACTTIPHAWRSLNSDFSNYYITAHLVRDHSATSRIYEWIWFQRQKDHLGVGQTFSAMPPLTPFSTLFLWPFTHFAPLAAKHLWLALNAALLAAIAWMLRRATGLRWSRIALLIAASYPLERNMVNGQYYILVLFFLTLGLWLHLRGHRASAGAAVAVAIGLKMFPLLYVLYFLRKRDWRALTGALAGAIAVATVSLAAFGWQLHRLYFQQVLPRGLRGESTGPFNLTSASFTVLFHRLFIYEPTVNPHPAIHAAWLFTVLLAIVQLLVVAPLLLLADPRIKDPRQTQLEWSAVLLACLTLSPLPASYHFVLLFLPIAVLLKTFLDEAAYTKLALLILLFLAIGYNAWHIASGDGWRPLLHVPRLYATIGLYVLSLSQLRPARLRIRFLTTDNIVWLGTLTAFTAISIALGLRYQQTPDTAYTGQLNLPTELFIQAQPLATPNGIAYISMQRAGYRHLPAPESSTTADELSHANGWTEQVTTTSQLVSTNETLPNAEQPILSPDGHWLAFTRENHGRSTLWLHSLTSAQPDAPITPPQIDILEASFAPDATIIFAALSPHQIPTLYTRTPTGNITQLLSAEARYPAVSPDGRWLVYSELTHGSWNLRLRNLTTGETHPLTSAPCNAVESTWDTDSRTLLFASDCGRAIGQTALYRRGILP